jgi:hypothetical protein
VGANEDRSMRPFRVSEYVYVKEFPNDTLYYLNEQYELIPQFVFNLGKYSYSKEKRGKDSRGGLDQLNANLKDILIIPNETRYHMIGSPHYIFFSTLARYSQNLPLPKGKTYQEYLNEMRMKGIDGIPIGQTLLGINDITNKYTRLLESDPVSRRVGLINDFDGGFNFWPRYYSSSNELIDFYQAYEMKEMLTEDYFAGHTIKNPQAHQKLKELLKKLRDDNNPVIVIAKLKK